MPTRPEAPNDAENNDYLRPSRSQKKRDSLALQRMGEDLTQFSESALAALPLTDDLREALREYRRIPSREGKRRQLQYLGRLMRELDDVQGLSEALDVLRHTHGKK